MSNLIPDILHQIFENIIGTYSFTFGRPKYKLLYPCILVNRTWCQTAIPILYREPFIRRNKNGYKLISTFLKLINDEKRALLYENDQRDVIFDGIMQCQRPLFDYSSYMYNLHYDAMLKNIDEWCQLKASSTTKTLNSEKQRKMISSTKNIFSHLFQKQSKSKSESIENMGADKDSHGLQCAIVDALLTLFIEHFVRLSKLRVNFYDQENYVKNMLLVQNIKLLSMIKEIYLTVGLHNNKFFISLAECCQTLELILIEFGTTDITGESISTLIQAQKKLCSITTIGMTNPCSNQLISSLASQSSSLKRAEFIGADFSKSTPWHGLASCTKLNTLTISHCQNIDDEMAQPLFDAKFECLSDVTITSDSCVKLSEWVQKFNSSPSQSY
ncbi:2975_t:CDS:2 [Ambispora leptoticha]|uniref:2975_t:CDS:1 n=1 Tax=Ambispora leptoticha TaxID=144679 RepID=A0A9N9C6E2_9GLOM|nr:2975_t:CDS:2 [Ambispora leptoticha]